MGSVQDQQVTEPVGAYNGDAMEVLLVAARRVGAPGRLLAAVRQQERRCSTPTPPASGTCPTPEATSEFFEMYGYFVRELHRVTMPGRVNAVHCMDVPAGNSGGDALIDFPGDVVRLHQRQRVRLPRPPRHLEGTAGRPQPDDGQGPHPQDHHRGLHAGGYRGRGLPADLPQAGRQPGAGDSPERLRRVLRRRASLRPKCSGTGDGRAVSSRTATRSGCGGSTPALVWDDIRGNLGQFDDSGHMAVLPYREARDEEDERHVHALQLDVIRRAVDMRTNPGETVVSPFAGVGSEIFAAVQLGRKAIGAELKPSYYRQMLKNLRALESWSPSQGELALDLQETQAPDSEVLATG